MSRLELTRVDASLTSSPFSTGRAEPKIVRDRANPSLFDALALAPTLPVEPAARRDMVTDLSRNSRRYLFPVIRVLTKLAVLRYALAATAIRINSKTANAIASVLSVANFIAMAMLAADCIALGFIAAGFAPALAATAR